MADSPSDFDFDFDVEHSDDEGGNGDATESAKPDGARERGNGGAKRKAGNGSADSANSGNLKENASASGSGLAPPPSRPSRPENGSDESEKENGAPKRRRRKDDEAPASTSFDDFLKQAEGEEGGASAPVGDPVEDEAEAPARRRPDDFLEGEEMFAEPAAPARSAPPEKPKKPAKRTRPKLLRPEPEEAEPAEVRPARRIGGIQLPGAPDLSRIGAKLRERGGTKVRGLRTQGGNGRPPWGGSRIKLPFSLPFGWGDGDGKKKRGRIKKGRLLIIVGGLTLLAMVSWVFGVMMAVSKDLPDLENRTEFKASENSVVYDVTGRKLGTLTSNNNRILVESGDIAQSMKQAAISIEDQRFYDHRGVDFQGIGRAVIADVIPGGSTQGASTITQQFVKNALEAQANRTPFEKLREAALAYHLERRWPKDKILTQYLNTIYFGEGAYGIEAAARTYFGYNHPHCGEDGYPRCASLLLPEESAMLAGIISAPGAFSPRINPDAALERRNLVLSKMVDNGYLTSTDAEEAEHKPLPSPSEIAPPSEDSISPYFTTWLRQQLVDKFGAGRAFGGGLRIKTTLDYDLQQSLEGIVRTTLGGVVPTASIVVIDNKTGGVRGMVGGLDYREHPFNLATNGHRQPGSSFKPFTLVTALEHGHSPGETYPSAPQDFIVPHSGGKEHFEVKNYENNYLGSCSITCATTYSDNSIYSQLGMNIVNDPQKSLDDIEQTAHKMGIQTDLSPHHVPNPAMILGGLIEGVTPLEMAYAYSTIANDGKRLSGTLAAYKGGPVSMLEIKDKDGKDVANNKTRDKQVLDPGVATTAQSILATVLGSQGTGHRAATGDPEFGKTGTTDNNGDAWFVGSNYKVTVAVWVGHADSNEPMETDFAGEPVDGGTYPALIWNQVIHAYDNIQAEREAGNSHPTTTSSGGGYVPSSGGSGSVSTGASGPATGETGGGASQGAAVGTGGGGGGGGAPTGGSAGGIGAGL